MKDFTAKLFLLLVSFLISGTTISCFIAGNRTHSGSLNGSSKKSLKDDSVFEWSLSLVGEVAEAFGGNASYVASVRNASQNYASPWLRAIARYRNCTTISCILTGNKRYYGSVNGSNDQSRKDESLFERSFSLVGEVTEALGGNASYVALARNTSQRYASPWLSVISGYRNCGEYFYPWDQLRCHLNQAKGAAKITAQMLAHDVKMLGNNVKEKVKKSARKIQHKVYSPWMHKGIIKIKHMIDEMGSLYKEKKSYKNGLLVLLALLAKLQNYSHLPPKNLTTNLSQSDIDLAKRFSRFSLKMEAVTWTFSRQSTAAVMEVDEDDILMTWFYDDDKTHCPKFLVFLDHRSSSIVLTIRGTFSLRDVILDLNSDPAPYLGGWAHRGILEGARKIIKESKQVLKKALEDFPMYNLVITGYSLGGSTGELITLDFLHGQNKEMLPAHVNISCIALGPPPVFYSANSSLTNISQIQVFINGDDVVPSLSLATVTKLLKQINVIENLDLTMREKMDILVEHFRIKTHSDKRTEKETNLGDAEIVQGSGVQDNIIQKINDTKYRDNYTEELRGSVDVIDTQFTVQSVYNFSNMYEAVQNVKVDKIFLGHPGTVLHIVQEISKHVKKLIVHEHEDKEYFTKNIRLTPFMILDHYPYQYAYGKSMEKVELKH